MRWIEMPTISAEVVEGVLLSPSINETSFGDLITWLVLTSSRLDTSKFFEDAAARRGVTSVMLFSELNE